MSNTLLTVMVAMTRGSDLLGPRIYYNDIFEVYEVKPIDVVRARGIKS